MLLLGVGPDGVRTLAEVTDPVEVDLLTGACRRRDESSSGLEAFSHLLQRTYSGNRNRSGATAFPSQRGDADAA